MTESSSAVEYKVKEQLYTFYYELSSEIQNKKLELDEDVFNEKIKSSTIDQIIIYIKEAIQILYNKEMPKEIEPVKPTKDEINMYEQQLRLYEQKIRNFTKMEFQNMLQNEAYECKIEDYTEMENEYEEMKTKYKFEEGKFLDNDRKEHEIIIVKRENTNLKKTMEIKEKTIEELNKKIHAQEKVIVQLREKISILEEHYDKQMEDSVKCSANGSMSQKNNNIKLNKKKVCHSNISNYESRYSAKGGFASPYQSVKINFESIKNDSTRNHDITKKRPNNKAPQRNNIIIGISRGNLDSFNQLTPNSPNSPTSRRNHEKKRHHQKNNSMGKILDQKRVDLMLKYFPNSKYDNPKYTKKHSDNKNKGVLSIWQCPTSKKNKYFNPVKCSNPGESKNAMDYTSSSTKKISSIENSKKRTQSAKKV